MNVWYRARRGLPAQIFWAYLAVALVIAMVSPGMAVFAEEVAPGQPEVAEPAAEPAAAPPVVEAPKAEEPAPAQAPVAAPAPEPKATVDPGPGASVEPIATAGGSGCSTYCEPTTGKIKVYKYEDKNGNGRKDGDEQYLSGWEFKVKDSKGAVVKTGTTGPGGWVEFSGLGPATYKVIETLQDGWESTTGVEQSAAVKADKTVELKFGNRQIPTGKLKVYKYEDKNGNGRKDGDEQYLSDWEFTLKDASGSVVTAGITGPGGWVLFEGLTAGQQYSVTETLKSGWANVSPLTQSATIQAGKTVQLEFGNRKIPTGKLKVYKYEDRNGNGVKDSGELYLSGWEFTVRDSSGALVTTGITSADGSILFEGLTAGQQYSATETLKSGWANVSPLTQSATIQAGKTAELRFGNRQIPHGKIIVHKYEDLNRNGTHDTGEPPLGGWDFVLKDATGAPVRSGSTAGDGTLVFDDLPLGSYTVEEVWPVAGWDNTSGLTVSVTLAMPSATGIMTYNPPTQPTPPDPVVEEVWFGNAHKIYTKTFELTYSHNPPELDGFQVDFTLNGVSQTLDLVASGGVWTASIPVPYPYTISNVTYWGHNGDGWVWLGGSEAVEVLEGDLTNYFHYDPSLTGYKWADLNGDGVWGEEPAIEGWTIYLYRLPQQEVGLAEVAPSVPAGAVLVETTQTDASGYYEFHGMLPGYYMVVEEVRPNWTPTAWPEEQPIWVGNEIHVGDLNFGNQPPVEKTFELTYHDAPEGLTYWVRYWIDDEPHMLELTGDGVPTGSVELPFGTTLDQIEWIAAQGEREYLLGTTGPETIEEDMLNQFEYQSHIGGYKFDDEDGEGDWDEGEPGIEGWRISLFREESTPPIDYEAAAIALIPMGDALTDGSGHYEFNGLLPGTYLVQEESRDGWTMTHSPEGTFVVGNGTDRDDLNFGNTQYAPFTEIDLAITKRADVEWASPGGVITYTLTYWNNGDEPASDFTIVDDYDERYLTVTDSAGGVVSGGKITWSLAGPLSKEDGKKTIVYKLRVASDMPEGTTNLDNTVEIEHPRDGDPSNNRDDERVRVKVGGEPFLPFTGGEYLMLLAAAVVAGAAGVMLRIRSSRTV